MQEAIYRGTAADDTSWCPHVNIQTQEQALSRYLVKKEIRIVCEVSAILPEIGWNRRSRLPVCGVRLHLRMRITFA